MIDTGVRVVASAPTAPFAIHQGIKKQRLTKEEMSVYGAREKATDLNLLVVDTQTEFVPLPRCFTGDEILMDLVKHRKQMSLPDFNDRVDGFISSKEMMDTLSVVGFNKALQQLTKSTKPRMASVKLKFSKNFKEAFGLKSALGYYGEAWKAAIAHAKGDYKHADRGGRNEFVGALLRIGDRMTTEDVPGGKLISAKTIRKVRRYFD